MRDKERGSQRLGATISEDFIDFRLYERNPVIVPDDRILIGYENLQKYDWNIVDCRDLVTVECMEDGLYYGYFAAAADVGRAHPVGVIAVAVSGDLLDWRDQSIVYIPRQNGVIEVPDVYEINGRWYLTMLNGTNYLGRFCGNDEYAICCTTYAVADNPGGPFVDLEYNILISGNAASG
jgi:Predicted glycosylase